MRWRQCVPTRPESARKQVEVVVEHLEMIIQKAILHLAQSADRRPIRVRRIIVRANRGEFAIGQIEEVSMGDGPAALASIGLVEDVGGLQTRAQRGGGQRKMGLFFQFPQRGLQCRFALFQKAARDGQQALPGAWPRRMSSTWSRHLTTQSTVTRIGG